MTDILGFGVSSTSFSLTSPQKLARGRENWIDELYDKRSKKNNNEHQENYDDVYRLVICGAKFQDSSASQAKRGLEQIDVDIGEILFLLYPEDRLVVYAEEVESAPVGASGIEWYRISRPFEVVQVWRCRWEMECKTPEDISRGLEAGGTIVLINPKEPQEEYINKGEIPPDCESEELGSVLRDFTRQHLYIMHTPKVKGAQYRAREIHYLLLDSQAVTLFHKDRNGVACAIYSKNAQNKEKVLQKYATENHLIYIPFLIPGFLARWDRAIADLFSQWDEEKEFPIPIVKGRWLDPNKLHQKEDLEGIDLEDNNEDTKIEENETEQREIENIEIEDSDIEDSDMELSGLEYSGLEDSRLKNSDLAISELESSELEISELEDSDAEDTEECSYSEEHSQLEASEEQSLSTEGSPEMSQDDSESFELNFVHEDEFQRSMERGHFEQSETLYTEDIDENDSEEDSW